MQNEPFDFGRCRQKLLDYVQAAQPHRSNEFRERIDAIVPQGPHKDALELVGLLIEFTYDVIERSSRRMIQEAVRLARSANSDADIRARLLDYLQEGLGSERIGRLLDQRDVDLVDWWELIEAVQTPLDAGELRGLCIRSLESYPDHPGLLLARAAAETMCNDHDDSVSWQGFKSAFEACAKYRIPINDASEVLDKLFDLAQVPSRAPDLGIPLTMASLDIGDSGQEFAYCAEVTLQRLPELTERQENVKIIQDYYAVRNRLNQLKDVSDLIVERLSHPVVRELLGAYK